MKKSWEAELIISGGFLLSLITIKSALPELNQFLFVNFSGYIHEIPISTIIIKYALTLIICGFILHILLRTCWLTFNGLSLNGINSDGFYKNTKFARFNNINIIDKIDLLNKLSGLVFSLSVIAFFLIISFTIWVCFLIFFGQYLMKQSSIKWLATALWITYISIGIPYLINFLTLHRFSKTKFYKFYYPFNEILSVLTLSFLYRSMTFAIFPRATWRIAIVMNFLMVGGLIFSTNMFGIQGFIMTSNLIGESAFAEHTKFGNYNKYGGAMPFKASIQNHIIEESYLNLSILHTPCFLSTCIGRQDSQLVTSMWHG